MNWIEFSINAVIILGVGGGLAFRIKQEVESTKWTESTPKIKFKKNLIVVGLITITSVFFAVAKIGISGNDNDLDLRLGIKVFSVLFISVLLGYILAKKK